MSARVNVLFARFPFGAKDEPDTTNWMVETVVKAKKDPRIDQIFHEEVDDTPIYMGRNRVLKKAKQVGAHVVVMVDNDMKPDAYLNSNPRALGVDPLAVPFWDSSFDFWYKHDGPCLVAAPYCGPPPHENVYCFRWHNRESHNPNADITLEQISRDHAEIMRGFEELAALPTGLILIDTRVLEPLPHPYFDYEWTDEAKTDKASTEDVVFTRNVSMAGFPIYCNWSAWAGHWKRKCVGRPAMLSVDQINEKFREAVLRNRNSRERRVLLGEGERRRDDRENASENAREEIQEKVSRILEEDRARNGPEERFVATRFGNVVPGDEVEEK